MKNKIIFIALDCSLSKAKSIIKSIPKTKSKKYSFALKIGYQIFYAKGGREFIKSLKGFDIFLDIKAHDIENTVKSAMLSIKDLTNVKYVTIHTSSGIKAIQTAKKYAGNKKLLGVTTLTNFDQKTLKEIGHTKNINNLIIHQAKLAKKAGCFAVICSGKESLTINNKAKIKTVTPGIRMPGDSANDQKRITTPKDALTKQKATGIVIGRSITQGNVKHNFTKLIEHLE